MILITTLIDAQAYARAELRELYRRRWQAELQLRSLKTHMGMEKLRCKTPEMVRKEFASYLLAYHCIRRVGAAAATERDLQPYEIGFKNTKQGEWVPHFLSSVASLSGSR